MVIYHLQRDTAQNPGVAQLGARLTGGQEAVSSSLATRTIKWKKLETLVFSGFFPV